MENTFQETDPNRNSNLNEKEVDLLALFKMIWDGRKIVLISILISGFLGFIFAISIPNVYTARTILVPQLKSEQQSGLGGLAALAGINIGISQSSEVSPLIYPQILKSIPFQLELMNIPMQFKNSNAPISLLEHNSSSVTSYNLLSILYKYTIGLPSLLLQLIRGNNKDELSIGNNNNIIKLTDNQKSVMSQLESAITINLNAKEGYLTLTAKMTEPLTAAQLAQKSIDLLQRYIIEFRVKKAKADLDFIQERFNEKKIEFEKAQEDMAVRIDKNKNFTSGLASIETDRLQTKYNLTYSIYQELARQLEQAKIQVKKETPVFVVLEPVTIPSEKSSPNRKPILTIWLFIGGVIGIVIVLTRKYLSKLRKLFKEILVIKY